MTQAKKFFSCYNCKVPQRPFCCSGLKALSTDKRGQNQKFARLFFLPSNPPVGWEIFGYLLFGSFFRAFVLFVPFLLLMFLRLLAIAWLPIMLKGHWQCFSLLHCCFLEGQLQVAAWLAQDKGFRGILWRLFVLARHPRNSRNSRHFRDGHRTWHEVGLLPELLLQRFSHRLGDILGNHTPASSNGNECFAQMG